jgi:tetratricopeptide (TPR) repeat protein
MPALLALAVLVVAAYATSLGAGFVLDNRILVLEDPRVHAATLENLRLILGQDAWWPRAVSGLYRPVATLSYLVDYAILGNADRPLGYHVVNLALHWGNAALVWLLARRVTGRAAPAFVAAAVFALHPIATEAVTNIIGRADLLAASAVLAGVLLHAAAGAAAGARRAALLATLGGVAALGVLSKESALILPGVLVLYDVAWPAGVRRRLPGYAAVIVALGGVWAWRAALFAGLSAPEQPFVDNPLVAAGPVEGRVTALAVLGRYLRKLAWPATLSPDYSYAEIPVVADWKTVAVALGIVALALATVAVRRRRPALFFFGGFFFVAMLPVSNLVRTIGTIMAERLAYLPSVGFAGCVALAAEALATSPRRRTIAIGAVAALLAAYGLRTAVRNRDWHDDVHLWEAAVRTSPGSFRTHRMLAMALARAEKPPYPSLDRIIAEGERAVAIVAPLPPVDEPSNVLLELATYYRAKGDLVGTPGSVPWWERAERLLERAVVCDRAVNEAHRRRELARGRPPAEIFDVGNWEVHRELGSVRLALGRPAEAAEAFAAMRHLAPNQPAAHLGLARAELAQGRADRAAVSLLRASVLEPGNRDAARLLADVYRRIDAGGCAVADGKLDASCPLVHDELCAAYGGLVALYRDLGEGARAEPFRVAALRTYGCSPDVLDRVD